VAALAAATTIVAAAEVVVLVLIVELALAASPAGRFLSAAVLQYLSPMDT
jgi:hypothetical protein